MPFGLPGRSYGCSSLFDDALVSFEIDGIKSDTATKGHRFLSPAAFRLKEIPGYKKLLANNCVIVDPQERKKNILHGVPVDPNALAALL